MIPYHQCFETHFFTVCFPASEDRDAVVGKDIYLNSTSKLDYVLQEDTVPLKGGSGSSSTSSPSPSSSNSPQGDVKQGNTEPRSEESDAGGVCHSAVCMHFCV